MTKFSISFCRQNPDGPASMSSDCQGIGQICIGEFTETFHANLSLWDTGSYERHWNERLSRLVNGFDRSGILTNYFDPRTANFFLWWTAYKFDDLVIFHNEILFLDKLDEFRIENLDKYISPYMNISEDGGAISEWQTSLADISRFLADVGQISGA